MKEQTTYPEKIKESSGGDAKMSLRVNVGLLDTLMTLAGELVLSRNQLLQGILFYTTCQDDLFNIFNKIDYLFN